LLLLDPSTLTLTPRLCASPGRKSTVTWDNSLSLDRIALLKEEYFHLQKTVDDFDQRTLTIKAWSETTSMAGIATSFLHDKIAILCLLSSLASLSFWAYHDLSRVTRFCRYPYPGSAGSLNVLVSLDTSARPIIRLGWHLGRIVRRSDPSEDYHKRRGCFGIRLQRRSQKGLGQTIISETL
jgi:hypothetical protein